MARKKVRRKGGKALPDRRDEDMFSNLPSCLILKIISLLPTKDAVATSVLSRSWRRMWTSITNLDFDDRLMLRVPSESGFERFVYGVLLQHDKKCLHKFSLTCNGIYDGALVNAWINSVLLSNVKELILSVPIKPPVLLPSDLFHCKSLVLLKLDAKGETAMPKSICLPSLKTLHLDRVKNSDDASIVRLCRGCPVLEELRLSQAITKDVKTIDILSATITSLTISTIPYNISEPLANFKYQFVIDTPALKYLNFSDDAAESYSLMNFKNLTKAVISIGPLDDGYNDINRAKKSKALSEFLLGVAQVERLILSSKSVEAMFLCDLSLPSFSNLVNMEIYEAYRVYLPKLLASSPCLETLYLLQGTQYGIFRPVDGVPPSCFLSHLKLIKIIKFQGLVYELKMVEYFLRNARVLEKLTLCFPEGTEKDAKILTQLLNVPRASTLCKVEVF